MSLPTYIDYIQDIANKVGYFDLHITGSHFSVVAAFHPVHAVGVRCDKRRVVKNVNSRFST